MALEEGASSGAPMKGVAMGSQQTSSTTVMNMSSSMETNPRRQHLLPWLAGGFGILLVAIVLGFVLLGRGPSSGGDGGKKSATAGASKSKPSAMGRPGPRTTRDAGISKVRSKPKKHASRVTLKVIVGPRKASVVMTFRGVHYRGNTFQVVVPRTKKPEKITIRAAGYRSETLVVSPSADINKTVTLRRVWRRRRPPRRRTAADWVMGIE